MSTANWYQDPTGRFAQRYFDGERWTNHVAGADGSQSEDATPVDPAMPAPGAPGAAPPPPVAPSPAASASVASPAASTASPYPAAGSSPTASASTGPQVGAGLVVSALGALATVAAMLALPWLSEGSESLDRAELSDLVEFFGAFDGFNPVTEAFFSFGWIVVMAVAVVALAVSFAPALKAPLAIACLLGAAWVLFAIVDVVEEVSFLAVGGYLAIGGPVVAAIGALMCRHARH